MESRRVSGPSGTTLRRLAALVAMLPWLSMTPFGSPVVPEVKTISASVSGVTCGRGSGSAFRAGSTSDSTVSTGSSRRPAAFIVGSDARTSLDRVCSASLRTSSSVLRTSTGTAMPSAHSSPRKASAHSGRFTAQISTRSPGSTPRWRRTAAIRGTWSPMSA